MVTLGLDTTTAWGSLGLCSKEPLAEVACVRTPRHEDPLLPSLEHVLRLARLERGAIKLIAVALGPGSFTSLRVGVCLAKGLALGLGVPLVGVSSLPLYAKRVQHEGHTLCALISDRKDRAYVSLFGQGRPQESARMMSPKELDAALQTAGRPLTLVGPGARALYRELSNKQDIFLACDVACQPSGVALAEAGLNQFLAQGADDLATLAPLYSAEPAISVSHTKRGDA